MITVKEVTVKKAIRKGLFADPFFANLYGISPYSGCEHGCTYCDGRAEKYFVEGDFERNITARVNLPELLDKELYSTREIANLEIGSGITDVYQSVEEKYKLTRSCGEVLLNHHFPVTVLTKSSLIQRDLDIWSKLNRKNGFTLIMSITTLDDSVRAVCEPGASTVVERLETLRLFKEAGCATGVFMMPLLPGITDGEHSVHALVEKLKELKVDFITPGFLTLRPGRQKEFYFNMLKEHAPHLLNRYKTLYGKDLISGNPEYQYRMESMEFCGRISGLPTEIPHHIYRNRMPVYQEIGILLIHMEELYKRRGIDVQPLKNCMKSYFNWASQEKKEFNRKRSLHGDAIDEKLLFMLRCGGFEKIVTNERLLNFIYSIALERKIFDYMKLSLYESD